MADFDEFEEGDSLIGYTVEIVTAHVSHSNVAMSDIPGFIQQVHGALAGLRQPAEPEATGAVPIIDPRKSVKPDHIICLECGKKMKMMKAHLRAVHGLDPHEYRAKYNLPRDYPMITRQQKEALKTRAENLGLSERMQAAREGRKPKLHRPRPVAIKS